MKKYAPHITISIGAVLVAAGHLTFPAARIDAVTVTLLVVAILPWLGSIFRSVELPGGLKVEYKDLEKVQAEAEQAGLLAAPAGKKELPAYAMIAEYDPNLALAGLRIEIEKRLRSLAQRNGIDARRAGIGQLMRGLLASQAISQREASVLNDMIGQLNQAVHGAEVDARAANWAIEVGSELLAALDNRLGDASTGGATAGS